jgi:flagellar hook-length control protein FliK
MAEIQAALPAKFMQVASAHKASAKDTSAPGVQLASFFGMLKSQMARQEITPEALELQGEQLKKPLEAELQADAALPAAGEDADATMAAAPVPSDTPVQSVVANINLPLEKPAVGIAQDEDVETGELAKSTGLKLVGQAKPDAQGKSAGEAIAAAARQDLPLDVDAEATAGSLAVAAVTSAVESAVDNLPASVTTSVAGLRLDAGAASASQISVAHPFDQALRQAEAKINAAIEAPVRSPAFAAELSDKVVWLATRQGQFADLSLNPPQMGALEVRLTLSGSDASAQFFSPNPVVREAIDAALPKLRELMAQAGINLGEADVREQAFSRRENAEFMAQTRTLNGVPESENATHTLAVAGAGARGSAGKGLVDLYI